MRSASTKTSQTYTDLWVRSLVPKRDSDDDMRVTVTAAWREKMRAERVAAGLTQRQLGAAVGTTQATISDIERGVNATARVVVAVCARLGIAPPQVVADEFLRRWAGIGERLRSMPPERAARIIDVVESMAELSEPQKKVATSSAMCR